MMTACRSWWRNCAIKPDPEIIAIDEMEDRIAPIDEGSSRIRELISSLELCHHKAERWVSNIIEAIGAGDTNKGLGTRSPGQRHTAEVIWQNACDVLSAWIAGSPTETAGLSIDDVPASRMLDCLGEQTAIKKWQVQRVVEKTRSVINWPQPLNDPVSQYTWLLLSGGEYDLDYRDRCPERYRAQEDFWLRTVRTVICDTDGGHDAGLSLGLAIDMLWPCHWRFVKNLQIVLEAIGGKLEPDEPFAACGRNIGLLPIRGRMNVVCDTLRVFCGDSESDRDVDTDLLDLLGESIEVKTWLASSLEKTTSLQLDPPADMRMLSALSGPDWIKK